MKGSNLTASNNPSHFNLDKYKIDLALPDMMTPLGSLSIPCSSILLLLIIIPLMGRVGGAEWGNMLSSEVSGRGGKEGNLLIFGDYDSQQTVSHYDYSSADDNGGGRKGVTSARHWNDEYNPHGREVPDSEWLFPLMITDRKLDGRMLSGMGMTRSEGNCAVDGFCFSNLNYGRDEDCTWVVGEGVTDGTLEFSQFDVESHSSCDYDYLLISGTKYCGTTAPTNLVVTAGDEIKWHSDGSEQRTGFNVCVRYCTATCGAGSGW